MTNDIYVRAHTIQLERQQRDSARQDNEPKWSDCALFFDSESRVTADQTMTFGFWRFCELRNGVYVPLEEGIFHDEKLSASELRELHKYARATKAETADDGCDRLRLYSRTKFVQEVIGIAIQAKALIAGFNLPFDLSRIAVDWNPAQNGGWTLIMKQWRNPKTGDLEPNESFPRVVTKALNSKTSILSSTRAPLSLRRSKGKRAKLWPRGRFLDVRTLLWALRNKSYSLRTACQEFVSQANSITSQPDVWIWKKLSIAGRTYEPPWVC